MSPRRRLANNEVTSPPPVWGETTDGCDAADRPPTRTTRASRLRPSRRRCGDGVGSVLYVARNDARRDVVEDLEADATLDRTLNEHAVVARSNGHRIVGEIDRLHVTPERYHVIDYKTNDTVGEGTAALAEHYRPQLLVYALALLQHDSDRSVRATLRFTDAGRAETFEWSAGDVDGIGAELEELVASLE